MSVRFGRGFGIVSGSSLAWVWELCSELGYRAHAAPVTLLVGCNRFVWDKYAGRSWSARCNASLVKVTRQGRGVGSGWVGAGARSVRKFRLGVHFTTGPHQEVTAPAVTSLLPACPTGRSLHSSSFDRGSRFQGLMGRGGGAVDMSGVVRK